MTFGNVHHVQPRILCTYVNLQCNLSCSSPSGRDENLCSLLCWRAESLVHAK